MPSMISICWMDIVAALVKFLDYGGELYGY